MLRDEQRGWAWTRALLGAAADEVHLCGEFAAIDIVKKLVAPIGEHVEVSMQLFYSIVSIALCRFHRKICMFLAKLDQSK